MTPDTQDTMRIWTAAYCTDPAAVKTAPCSDGREHPIALAHYVFRRATELFGPRGLGWGHTPPQVERHERPRLHLTLRTTVWYIDPETGQRGEIPTQATTALESDRYVKDERGNKIRDPETGRWRTYTVWDPDAEQKALTSAVKAALGQLGFAQDLRFENRPLGGASAPPDPTPGPPPDRAQAPPQSPAGDASSAPATDKQMALIRKLSPADGKKNLTKAQASDLISTLMDKGDD